MQLLLNNLKKIYGIFDDGSHLYVKDN